MPSEPCLEHTHAFDGTTAGSSRLFDDEEFDRIFPERVRDLSPCHWTPVEAARQAARWLVTGPGTRVLDVGCGPGKFCAIGAATTLGHFTGVEQRSHLCRTGRSMLGRYGIPRVDIIQANVMDVSFREFDAFYFFNPFEENVFESLKIDEGVDLNATLFFQYRDYVRGQLSRLPEGTRVVTYWGDCEEIPSCYDCEETACAGKLRLWIKRRDDGVQAREDADAAGTHCDQPGQGVFFLPLMHS